jgi:2,3-bisphosphoglycerate-dependent phosphoglycerate mutase
MPKLYLLRHLQSQWNLENRFTGWTDVPLSKEGIAKTEEVAEKVAGIEVDVVYTSPLVRNQDTVLKIWQYLEDRYPIFLHFQGKMKKWGNFTDGRYLPVYVSEALNERYYGKLQGLNKDETIKRHGAEKVRLWRRGFKQAPPGGESLKDTFKRALPFYKKYIEKDLKQDKVVLIVASHNSLRALAKYIENVSDQDIINLEIPVGTLIEYQFDQSLVLKNKKIL